MACTVLGCASRAGVLSENNANVSFHRISRRGRKLQQADDTKTLLALPKEIPERIWAEILQKEESDLLVLDIREELIEEALKICYDQYMEKENALFTAHCAAEAWLKIIDWHFYKHDPGEEPSAYPPCYIPKREESWIPDKLPDPSPRDTWCKDQLAVFEEILDESSTKSSTSTLEIPQIEDDEEIPKEYWFPGRVRLQVTEETVGYEESDLAKSDEFLTADSEMLQKITDYTTTDVTPKESTPQIKTKESPFSTLKTNTPMDGSLQGAGDSNVSKPTTNKKRFSEQKSKLFSKMSMNRSKWGLQPLDMESKISVISDCRLRNLRLDTQFEITSEKVDTPPGETTKRK